MQWLQSKVVMIVAGLILVSSITGVFYWQIDSIKEEELEQRCEKIARVIDRTSDINAEVVRQKITFDEESQGIYISPEVGGDPYSIKIYPDLVMLESDVGTATNPLEVEVHLWGPEDLNRTGTLETSEQRWRDSRTEPLEITTGEEDILLRKLSLSYQGNTSSHVFVSGVDSS